MDLDELKKRLPLQLRPGESLYVEADYAPPVDLARATPYPAYQHGGTLHFMNNSDVRDLVMGATGTGLPGKPRGEWRPDPLLFGNVLPGQNKTLYSGLVSEGDLPLCVKDIHLEDPNKGFSVARAPLIESEVMGMIITFNCPGIVFGSSEPPPNCSQSTNLIAVTNAGEKRLPLYANMAIAVPPPPPTQPCVTEEDVFRGCHS